MAVTAVGRRPEDGGAAPVPGLSHLRRARGQRGQTFYCEGFEKITQGCPVPVVIAGGPKTDSELEVLEFVYDGMQQGAIGVNLGRNIWQNDNPVAMAPALQAVIHEDVKPQAAHELFLSLKHYAPRRVKSQWTIWKC